jgi:hypothetical protein
MSLDNQHRRVHQEAHIENWAIRQRSAAIQSANRWLLLMFYVAPMRIPASAKLGKHVAITTRHRRRCVPTHIQIHALSSGLQGLETAD